MFPSDEDEPHEEGFKLNLKGVIFRWVVLQTMATSSVKVGRWKYKLRLARE